MVLVIAGGVTWADAPTRPKKVPRPPSGGRTVAAPSTAAPASAESESGWHFKAKIGLVQNNGANGSVGTQAGFLAEYRAGQYLSWRTDLNLLFPDLNDMEQVQANMPSNLLLYPLGRKTWLSPYTGPGITWNLPLNEEESRFDFNYLAGVNFQFPKQRVFGIEARYTLTDMDRTERGTWEMALTGSWELEFGN